MTLFPRLLIPLVLAVAALPARADTWPSKPIRFVVPYAAGGGGDAIARPWAERLSAAFGQQFVVENKGGASGTIGTEMVARAPADGYTLLATPNSALTVVPQLRPVAYHWDRDLQPVARTGDMVAGVVLAPNVPANSLKELFELARAKPEEITCGSAGLGTLTHIRCELFAIKAGAKIRHIPYRGSAEALNDLLGGHISMMSEANVLAQAKAGTIKIVAIIDGQRHPDFPAVPTLAEAGVPDFEAPIWYGIIAPKGVPREIVDRINAEVRKIATTEEMKTRILSLGYRAPLMTADEMRAQMEQEWTAMGALIKQASIKLE